MKKPMIRSRAGQMWTEGADWIVTSPRAYKNQSFPVRVCDAREITPEKAIAETILRTMYLDGTSGPLAKKYLPEGYTATVKNGKVTVRKVTK